MAETLKDYLVGIGFSVDENGAQKAENALNEFHQVVNELGNILLQTGTAIKSLFSDFLSGSSQVDDTTAAIDDAANAVDNLSQNELDATQAAAEMAEAQEAVSTAASSSAEVMQGATDAADALGAAHEEAASAANEFATTQEQVGNAAQSAGEQVEKLGKETQETGKKAKNAGKAFEQASRRAKMDGAKEGAENVGKLDGKLKEVTQTLKKAVVTVAGFIIGDSIKNAVANIVSFNETLTASAKELGKTIEQARAYNVALSAMGKTVDEIAASDSLTQTFEELQSLGQQMALPAGAQGLIMISRLKDGFLQLKVIGQYAMQWIYYKVQTVAEGPLAKLHDTMTSMKDWFAGNIEKIAETIATGFSWVLQIFSSAVTAIKHVATAIGALPIPVKLAGAAIVAVITMVKSKFALITAVVTGILLLVDDFVTYLEGGESVFANFWGKCIEWAQKLKPVLDSVINAINGFITSIWEGTISLISWLKEAGMLEPLIAGITAAFAAFKGLKLATAIANVVSKLKALPAALGGISAPVLAVIAVLVAAFVNLWNTSEEFQTAITAIWNSIKEKFQTFGDAIVARLNKLGFSFENIGEVIKAIWNGICSFLAPAFEATFEEIETFLSTAFDTILSDAAVSAGTNHSVNAYAQLRAIMSKREPVTLVTRLHSYKNMVITSMSAPDDYMTMNALKATIYFRQIEMVSVSTVTVQQKVSASASGQSTVTSSTTNSGSAKKNTSSSSSQSSAKKQSVLSKATSAAKKATTTSTTKTATKVSSTVTAKIKALSTGVSKALKAIKLK